MLNPPLQSDMATLFCMPFLVMASIGLRSHNQMAFFKKTFSTPFHFHFMTTVSPSHENFLYAIPLGDN